MVVNERLFMSSMQNLNQRSTIASLPFLSQYASAHHVHKIIAQKCPTDGECGAAVVCSSFAECYLVFLLPEVADQLRTTRSVRKEVCKQCLPRKCQERN